MKRTLITIALTLLVVGIFEWQTIPYRSGSIFSEAVYAYEWLAHKPYADCFYIAPDFPHLVSACDKEMKDRVDTERWLVQEFEKSIAEKAAH